MNHDGIVFVDADDTLWENNRWFNAVLREWASMLARHGVDGALATRELHRTEDRNIPLTGYGSAPFVRSAVEAFHALVPDASHEERDEMAHFARRAEQSIRLHPIELLAGVADALPVLARSRRVVVMTKGDDDEQRAKVERSGLARWLHAVHVVPEKDAACYSRAVGLFGGSAATSWMVGNSATADVNPAISAGLRAIHVPHRAPWHRDVGPLHPAAHVAATFADVPGIVFERDRR